MTFLVKALEQLRPGESWTIDGEDEYENIQWLETGGKIKPTKEEIEIKIEEIKAEEPMRLLRIHRDKLIIETDWWVLPDRTPTPEQLAYRQALRDLPETATPVLDPTNPTGISGVNWPIKPQ
jgi:hypothetical protein